MRSDKLKFRVHALQRIFQRNISIEDVRYVLTSGEVIEDYPEDEPYPSFLILGWRGSWPIHVVAAYNIADDEIIVITVYEPDKSQWEVGFKRRKP